MKSTKLNVQIGTKVIVRITRLGDSYSLSYDGVHRWYYTNISYVWDAIYRDIDYAVAKKGWVCNIEFVCK